MIFRTDVNGTIVYVDSEWTMLSGYSTAESVGRKLEDFLPPEDRQGFSSIFMSLMREQHRSLRQHLRYQTKFHGVREFDVLILKSIDDHNNILGTVGSIPKTSSLETTLLDSNGWKPAGAL